MHRISISVLFVLSTLGLIGCDGAADQAFDCSQICNRYSDCYDADYDVDGCIDDCRANADADASYAEGADACETCLDDRSCSGSFECVDQCIGVVP